MAPGTRGMVVVLVPDEIGVVQPPAWVTAPTPLTLSASSSADTSRKKLAVTAEDSGPWPEVPRRQQPGELPRGHNRPGGRDGPPAMRPDHGPDRPEAGDRGLMGLQFGHPDLHPHRGGLAQVVLGLGHDQLRLGRRDPQPRAQLRQVPGDQVGGRPDHADHPGSAAAGPAAGGHPAWAAQPSTACTPPANLRHSVCWAASAATPRSVSP